MLHPSSPYKRDRVEVPEEYELPEKMMGLPTVGCENSDAPGVRASASHTNYPSTSKASPSAPAGQIEDLPNKVLLLTVVDPMYPITKEIMYKVCTFTGAKVERIVILRKNGVQAMVEFDSVEGARSVKDNLSDVDIYSGCCSLNIAWGKSPRVNVVKNGLDSWDYTLKNQDNDNRANSQPLLPDPKLGGLASYGLCRRMPPGGQRFSSGPIPCGPGPQVDMYRSSPKECMLIRGPAPGIHDQQPPVALAAGFDSISKLQQGSVLMVYGLNSEKMNCQKIFNLFCLYGNVVRVKFMKSKEGVAMVQLGDNISCERAIKNINGSFVFGKKMLMCYSKQAFIQDVPNPVALPDGTVSCMDFMGNRNNRFTNPEAIAKNHIQSTSKVLYFFNAPPGVKDNDLTEAFSDCKVNAPTKIRIFPSKTERSSNGLLQWDSKEECVEALVAANHALIKNPNGNNPYILKLCFSDAPIKG